ncbi:MAG: phage virion morphogenesis protein [Magnetococcales bacterium]|nr:phage virion morphogenesis protein [Magnetococcales bacterium]
MAGTHINVEMHGIDVVQDMFRQMRERSRHLDTAMKEVGEHMLESTQERFDAEKDPDGNKWAPHSEVTKKRRGGGKILTDTGRLRHNSISYRVEGDTLIVGANAVYAAIHQLGGEAGRKSHRVMIPARPYLGFSGGDRQYAMDTIRDYIVEG